MKNKLLYIGILAATVYLAVLYDFAQMRFLVAFELLLPLADGLLTYIMGRSVQVEVMLPSAGAAKKDMLPVYVEVENTCPFPVSRLEIQLEERQGFTDHVRKQPLDIIIDGRSRTRFVYETEAEYCGSYTFILRQIRIWGYLKLFARRRKLSQSSQVDVMPDIYNMDVIIRDHLAGYQTETEKYDQHRPGDDPSEIFQVRGYQPGDSIQRIHWKLSARGDELIVKDYSRPAGMRLLLLLDMALTDGLECGRARIDSFMETGISLSRSLILGECPHQAAWMGQDGTLRQMQVEKETDVYELIRMLFRTIPQEQEHSLEKQYEASHYGKLPPTVLRLDLQLCLYRNGAVEKKFTEGQIEELEGYPLTI